MLINPYWFSLRKNIILSFLIDVFIFAINFNIIILKVYDNGYKTIIFNYLILFFWLLVSYIIGRYHQNKKDILENITNISLSTLNFFIYFSFTYVLFYKFLDFKDNYIYWDNFIFFIKYIITSFFIQFALIIFLKNKSKSLLKWEFVGSEDSFNRLANLIDSNKIKINFAGSIDKLLVDSKKVKNIIIEKLSDSSLKHQEKIINLYFRGENI